MGYGTRYRRRYASLFGIFFTQWMAAAAAVVALSAGFRSRRYGTERPLDLGWYGFPVNHERRTNLLPSAD